MKLTYIGRHRAGPGRHRIHQDPRGHIHTADIVFRDRIICRCGFITARAGLYATSGGDGYLETVLRLGADFHMRSLLWRAVAYRL
jgi:hypothetical protein